MSTKRTVARNVIWNWAALGANLLAGFVVAPFLVHRLGEAGYGLWILIASLITYFSLLDMGVRAAVGRQIALFRAREDQDGVNATLNTALAMLCGAGVLALLGTLGISLFFFKLFEVPPAQVHEVRISLLIVAVTLVLWLPLNLFDAVLWAYQRFDLINVVGIAGAGLRVALTFWFLGRGYGLIALAVINLISLAGMQAVKGVIVFIQDRNLRLGARYIRRDAARALLGIGFWNVLLTLAGAVNGQAGSAIIGARIAVSMVTPFSVAERLIGYAKDLVMASTGVLTPIAIAYHAGNHEQQQRRLYVEGSKYCLTISIILTMFFVVLGRQILVLWMGPTMQRWALLLAILTLGELVPMSQWVGFSIILGKYRHQALAWIGVVENILAIGLALAVEERYGLIGVGLAFAVPATLCRGFVQMVYACRLVNVRLWEYASEVLLPVCLSAVLPALGLLALYRWRVPHSWLELLLYASAYGLAQCICTLFMVRLADLNPSAMAGSATRFLAKRVAMAIRSN